MLDMKTYNKKTINDIKEIEEPQISVGIICFKLSENIYETFKKNVNNISYYDVNNTILDNINKFNKYNNEIQFLLVKRRNSLNYIDFMRGKYNVEQTDKIKNMISYMSEEEIELIKTKDFNYLWSSLWLKNAYKKKYLEEMNLSKSKFNDLKVSGFFDDINHIYKSTEWEIPKGRKNSNEKNLECALREFKEETSIDKSNYSIIKCLDAIHDNFIGTNGKEYRHVFYPSLFDNNFQYDENYNNNEIDMIKWCNWSELHELIRPYNASKINILTSLFLFIINICEINNYQFKNKATNNINVVL